MFLFQALKVGAGFPRPSGAETAPLPSIWAFRIDPASISLIEGTPRLFQIAWMNRTDHLTTGSIR